MKKKTRKQAGLELAPTLAKLSEKLDCTRETCSRWLRRGAPKKGKDGYDITEWRAWMSENAKEGKRATDVTLKELKTRTLSQRRYALMQEIAGEIGSASLGPAWDILQDTTSEEQARERRAIEWCRAKLIEIKNDVRAGRLVDEEYVSRLVGDPFQSAVEALRAISHQKGHELVGLDAGAAQKKLNAAVAHAMEQFSLGEWAKSDRQPPIVRTIKKLLDDLHEKEFGPR